MAILNFVLIAALLIFVVKAVAIGLQRGHSDRYFKKWKLFTGQRFHNFFGLPRESDESRFNAKFKS
ncbi:hypothetical protein [Magnetococcus marinus]|uniref:hypothetical protein n=1 Tax=Magnetococcus marinus TaxID=1124597 RepID=UPI0000381A8E|nr:hypothetical protein [Magnetococcus marinus]